MEGTEPGRGADPVATEVPVGRVRVAAPMAVVFGAFGLALIAVWVVLTYRMHQGQLPLGETAVFIQGTAGRLLFFLFPLVILLFPDGRLTRRWAWVLWSYLLLVVVLMTGLVANEVGTLAGRHI